MRYVRLGLSVFLRAGRFVPRVLLPLTLLLAIWAPSVGAIGTPVGPQITVMTWNMDEGADFGPIFDPSYGYDFFTAVADTWQEIQNSNPPERASGVADEIGKLHPDLVALQEADQWYTGQLGGPADTLKYDQLLSLTDALATRGLHYDVVAIATNLDIEVPDPYQNIDVRLVNHDVLLVRSDLRGLSVTNIDVQHFQHLGSFSIAGHDIQNPRGWIAAEVTIDAHTFRLVTTHLEGVRMDVQEEQANEMIQGPGDTSLPVVFAGDFNSDAGCDAAGTTYESGSYNELVSAGFDDAWLQVHGPDTGCTWPLHAEDFSTQTETPNIRIDLILFKNGTSVRDASLVGNSSSDLTASGLWPSDHAGVFATLRIPPSQHQ